MITGEVSRMDCASHSVELLVIKADRIHVSQTAYQHLVADGRFILEHRDQTNTRVSLYEQLDFSVIHN